jgi:hypothetical protein
MVREDRAHQDQCRAKMNVTLVNPVSIVFDSAKLVVEDSGLGTLELMILGQPVRLYVSSTDYVYDISFQVGDTVRLLENFGAFAQNSQGTVQEIIPDYTQDKAKVLFNQILPDQTINPAGEAHVISTAVSLLAEVPVEILEKV